VIVGRHFERARIDEVIASLREGSGHSLVVSGEAGIGKSVLLSYASAQAKGLRVLRARGVETETDLAFSGLHELLRPLLEDLERIPPRQAEALRGALALEPAETVDRVAVYAGTLTVLATAAERTPVLALVDDLHWLDSASAEAIWFAARRLAEDPVAFVFGRRETEGRPPSMAGLEELRLGGLDVEDATELLEDFPVSPSVAAQLVSATEGNPLALIELPSVLNERVLRGEHPLPEPLPATPSAERAFRRRSDELPAEVRSAVLMAAAFGGGDLGPIKGALAARGIDPEEALEAAEEARLIRLQGARFEFVHPLARSALYDLSEPAERRGAHAALADTLQGDYEADRRAWHLGAAAIGPDEEVASLLETSADRALARGGFAAASAAHERAADLSEAGEPRARRLTAAADAAQLAGAGERALRLLEQALENTTDAVLRAEIQSTRGFISFWRGDFSAARTVFEEAARVESVDPARAAVIYAELTGPCFMRGDCDGFLEMGQRARDLAEPDGGFAEFMGVSHWGRALMYAGRVAEARPYLLRGAAIAESDPAALADPVWAAVAAGNLGLLEEEDRARALLNRLVREARATSSFGVLTLLLPFLAGLERDAGDWHLARALAVESIDLSRDTGQSANLLNSLGECALLAAGQGREAECQSYTREALELAHAARSLPDAVYVHMAVGLLYLGLGRAEQTIVELEPVVRDVRGRGIGEPQVVATVPELVEAYIRVGRTLEAVELLADFERLAADSGLASQLAASCRCRGLLAPNEEFEAIFRTGLAQCDRVSLPFERARIELCLGERLRRARRRIDARAHLRNALSLFDQLGAAPWAEKARSELRASGETIRPRESGARDALTPQELKVALAVAEGLTNREAAAALFLSPKTIEAHLGRVFRKLGIRSRSQLARVFAGGPEAPVEALKAEQRTLAS
jgi:DNA-binding CsgD family transcriptional regulator